MQFGLLNGVFQLLRCLLDKVLAAHSRHGVGIEGSVLLIDVIGRNLGCQLIHLLQLKVEVVVFGRRTEVDLLGVRFRYKLMGSRHPLDAHSLRCHWQFTRRHIGRLYSPQLLLLHQISVPDQLAHVGT